MRDAVGLSIPAVVADTFKYVQQILLILLQITQDLEGDYLRLLSNSLVFKWDAKTVPLQPVVQKMPSSLRPAVLAGNDRMANFYPLGLSRENIGSNEGLSKIMRKLYIDCKMNQLSCARYTTFSVDVNIYDRTVKVCCSNILTSLTDPHSDALRWKNKFAIKYQSPQEPLMHMMLLCQATLRSRRVETKSMWILLQRPCSTPRSAR